MGTSFVISAGTCLKRLGEEQVHAHDVAVVLEEIVAVQGIDPPVLEPEVNLRSQVMGQGSRHIPVGVPSARGIQA